MTTFELLHWILREAPATAVDYVEFTHEKEARLLAADYQRLLKQRDRLVALNPAHMVSYRKQTDTALDTVVRKYDQIAIPKRLRTLTP